MLTGKLRRSYPWKGFHLWDISGGDDVTLIQWEISGASTQFLKNGIFYPAQELRGRQCVLQGSHTAPSSQGTKLCSPSRGAVNTGTPGIIPESGLPCAPEHGIAALWLQQKARRGSRCVCEHRACGKGLGQVKGHSTGPATTFRELGHSLGGEEVLNTSSRFIPSSFSPGKAVLPGGKGSGHRESEEKGRAGQDWHQGGTVG